ncbi:MAG TPA: tRNA lysidine(34) synthetase TilS [Planctomycetes bacterium]|nr:tRNA lysidine(34) synthetase TilS [Planctomycetota bacterium]
MHDASFLDTIARALAEQRLCADVRRLLVAVSGGRDSVALLLALLDLLRDKTTLVVGHVHHGLRGAEADADMAFTEDLAAAHGLPFVAARITLPQRPDARSYEAPARAARYGVFARWARELALDAIATGHTADDQVETVLLRLLRGAGIAGLCGIPFARPLAGAAACSLIRPLLGVTRADTTAFLAARGARFRDDASNLDARIPRNRLRSEILPVLRAGFNARLDAAVRGLADDARELTARARVQVAPLLPAGAGPFAAPRAALAALSPIALHELLVAAAARLTRRADRLTRGHVRAVRAVIAGARRKVLLPGGFAVARAGDGVFFSSGAPAGAPPECTLDLGAQAVFGDWVLVCLPAETVPAGRGGDIDAARFPRDETIDADTIAPPLAVRARRPGDRFRPLGAPGRIRLKEFFRAQGIPEHVRDAWPIVCAGADIVWVPGLRIGQKARLSPATRGRLVLRIARAPAAVRALLASRSPPRAGASPGCGDLA